MLDQEWLDAIDDYDRHAVSSGHPKTTRSTRRQHLQHLARRVEVGPWALTSEGLRDYAAAQTWAPETRRGRRTTFKSFYGWAKREGHASVNLGAKLPKPRVPAASSRPAPDRVYREALLAAHPRESLMLRLAAEVGMRRAEVAKVHSRDLMEDLGFAFPGADEGHLSPRYVGKLIASVMPDQWTMHTLRHRFATRAYALRSDLLLVQEMLGHASPTTTRRYIAYDRARMRAVVEELAG